MTNDQPTPASKREPGDILTCEARDAIRGYLIKLFTLPAIFGGILSFVLGFGIKELATGEAYTKAYSDATKTVLAITAEAAKSAAEAATAKKQLEVIVKEVETTRKEVETTRDSTKKMSEAVIESQAKADAILQQKFDKIALELLKDDGFRGSLATVKEDELARLRNRVEAVFSSIPTVSLAGYRIKMYPGAIDGAGQSIAKCADPKELLIGGGCVNRGVGDSNQPGVGPVYRNGSAPLPGPLSPMPMDQIRCQGGGGFRPEATAICLAKRD